MIVRDDQGAKSRAHVAVANGDRVIDSRLQPIVPIIRLRDRGHGAVPVDR